MAHLVCPAWLHAPYCSVSHCVFLALQVFLCDYIQVCIYVRCWRNIRRLFCCKKAGGAAKAALACAGGDGVEADAAGEGLPRTSFIKTRIPLSMADNSIPNAALSVGIPRPAQVITAGRMNTASISQACCLSVNGIIYHSKDYWQKRLIYFCIGVSECNQVFQVEFFIFFCFAVLFCLVYVVSVCLACGVYGLLEVGAVC